MKTATTAQVSISPTTPNSQPPTAPSVHVTVPLKAYELPKSAQHVATAVNAASLNAATTTVLVGSATTAVLSLVLQRREGDNFRGNRDFKRRDDRFEGRGDRNRSDRDRGDRGERRGGYDKRGGFDRKPRQEGGFSRPNRGGNLRKRRED